MATHTPLDEILVLLQSKQPSGITDTSLLDSINRVITLGQKFERRERYVAFFGVFSAGKSTFLNALLGCALLPAHSNRTTGVITEIHYGKTPTATVHLRDGQTFAVTIDDIGAYIRLETTRGGAQPPPNVERVQIFLPLPMLEAGLVLVDTPGLLDSEDMTERTFVTLSECDMGIMLLAADRLLGMVEREAAERAASMLSGNLAFVLNRLNIIDINEHDEVINWARGSIQELNLGPALDQQLFVVNGLDALNARLIHQNADELQVFERWLAEALRGKVGERRSLRARIAALRNLLSETRALSEIAVRQTQAAAETVEHRERAAHMQKLDEYDSQLNGVRKRILRIPQQDYDLHEKLSTYGREQSYTTEFAEPVRAYADHINNQVRRACGSLFTTLRPPQFEPTYSVSVQPAADHSGAAATGAGLAGAMIGSLILPGFGTVIGGLIGAGWGGSAGDERRNTQNNRRLSEAVDQLVPLLEGQVRAHIAAVDQHIASIANKRSTRFTPSAALQKARAVSAAHQDALAWCDQLIRQIEDTIAVS